MLGSSLSILKKERLWHKTGKARKYNKDLHVCSCWHGSSLLRGHFLLYVSSLTWTSTISITCIPLFMTTFPYTTYTWPHSHTQPIHDLIPIHKSVLYKKSTSKSELTSYVQSNDYHMLTYMYTIHLSEKILGSLCIHFYMYM